MGFDLTARTDDPRRATERFAALQQLTAALAGARTYAEVASVIIDQALPALQAEVGVVALASEDERMLRNVGFKGVDAATEAAWEEYSVDAPVPVAEAARTKQTIVVRTLQDRNARYPVLAEVHGLEHGGPVITFPLIAEGKLLGVLGFCWAVPLPLEPDDLGFLQTLADQCGLAIERARLYEIAQREIAERKASEERLRVANQRKDEFLAMLAHELRNPLAPIRSAADLLELLGGSDPRLVKIHHVVRRQSDHMKRIVDDLLDVARVTQDRMALELAPVDLAEIVRATTSDHAGSFAKARVTLRVHLPDAPLWARADATRIAQALANLLDNARKFSEAGETVTVSLQADAAGAILEVRDHGAGIQPDLREHLFEPFSQADRTLARSRGGLGLGLAIVSGIARLHGGDVSVESDGPGSGSAFRITLPLLPAAEIPASNARASEPPHKKRILVVEDNRDAAELLALVLDTLGHEVRLAHTAREALELLDGWHAEVILSDIGLPDIDGFTFAESVRARPRPQNSASNGASTAPLLVAISGYGNEEHRTRARQAGFDAYLTKPVDRRTLADLLSDPKR